MSDIVVINFASNLSDKFCKTSWYSHLGIYAAGFANGLIVAGFEGNINNPLTVDLNEYGKSVLDFTSRSLGVVVEFGLTSYAKSKYKYINGKDFGGKFVKGSLKNLGYILTTYY